MFSTPLRWLGRAVGPLVVLVHLCTVSLLVWVGIRFYEPETEVVTAVPSMPSTKFRMDQAAEARLFGVNTAGGLTPPSVRLKGVFASSAGKGSAVMSIEGRTTVSVDVGDEVANGWILVEVSNEGAVISRSGVRHTVKLPQLRIDDSLIRMVPAGSL